MIGPFAALLAVASAAAAGPAPVRLSAERSDAPDRHSAEAIARGQAGAAALALCRPVVDGVQLCVRTQTGPGWRLATEADAAAWKEPLPAVWARATDQARAAWRAKPPVAAQVEGMPGTYYVRQAGDGAEALPLAEPACLSSAAPVEGLVLAFPERGTLLFWRSGDADFDKVLGVGARRMAESVQDNVTAAILKHDGQAWRVWAEVEGDVQPRSPAPSAAPAGRLPPSVRPP